MKTIVGTNVEETFQIAMMSLEDANIIKRDSRNGPVLEFPTPVCSTYIKPTQRVMFNPIRDANPYFHFFESLWMLAGRNDVAFVSQFNKGMKNFSDDGVTFNGAYGYRWIYSFDYDQLQVVVDELKKDPDSRRCVVSMWDPKEDLKSAVGYNRGVSKDVPCNTQIFFYTREGKLDMTVCNRSNDMIWGCYGANAVHFSYLQEYMAASIGVEIGRYYQISNSLHLYTEIEVAARCLENIKGVFENIYEICDIEPYPLFTEGQSKQAWDKDLLGFMDDPYNPIYSHDFFGDVVIPLWNSWHAHKAHDKEDAIRYASECKATDWRKAAREWLYRRYDA